MCRLIHTLVPTIPNCLILCYDLQLITYTKTNFSDDIFNPFCMAEDVK